jgi:nicotinate phosphoribosyltransferase
MKNKPEHLALLSDLYEFTMAAAFYKHAMVAPATFSLFIRDYPLNRGYLVNAGLEAVLDLLDDFRFRREEIDFLAGTRMFADDFLHYLSKLRFTGDVFAMPEGSLFFRNEPVLEITGPIIEAQLVETLIINAVNLQVTIASKAARSVYAAQGRGLVDFSLRRTQGTDAGLKVARASYIAGFGATSNVLAGKLYGIPIAGTMAHSFITSFKEEVEAFRAFAHAFPQNIVLLLDTYDTVTGAQKAVALARELAKEGISLKGVRLDSGDIATLSKEVRKILDDAGLQKVSIFASGGLDEQNIAELLHQRAPIDAFGVGTKMGVSADAPYMDMAYKLVKYDSRPVMKCSTGKQTLVSEKQVFRVRDKGKIDHDIIGLRDEKCEGEPLLHAVMKKGKRLHSPEPLALIRKRFAAEFAALDDAYKRLQAPKEFRVARGPALRKLQNEVMHRIREEELGES